MGYKDFTEMPVWKKSFQLMLRVYSLTKKFPKDEKFGLISDMRRASQSVTNNISEGYGRFEKYDKIRFYKISRGSSYELINQTLGSEALNYLSVSEKKELESGYREVIQALDLMIKTLEKYQKDYKKTDL
jgi:four helix bundle protein